MKRLLMLTLCLVFILFLCGCKVDLEAWVDKSGGGHGTMILSGMPMGESDLRGRLSQKSIDLISFIDKGVGVYEAKIKWSDFVKSFGPRKVNNDGSIFLDFGNVELGSITVHIDGKIIREKTQGNIKDDKTVVFTSGRATVVYTPTKAHDLLPIILIGMGIFAVVILAIFIIKRANTQGEVKVEQTEEAKLQDEDMETDAPYTATANLQSSEAQFCANCGTELLLKNNFCTKCGTKVQ